MCLFIWMSRRFFGIVLLQADNGRNAISHFYHLVSGGIFGPFTDNAQQQQISIISTQEVRYKTDESIRNMVTEAEGERARARNSCDKNYWRHSFRTRITVNIFMKLLYYIAIKS